MDRLPAQAGSTSPGDGLTLAEVREIAREVGVEAKFIDRAAASLLDAQLGTAERLLGGPLRTHLTETLDRPLSETERLEVVDLVRRVLHHTGEIKEVMGSVEWRSVGTISGTRVMIISGEENASIRVFSELSGIAAFTWIGSIATGIFTAIAVLLVSQSLSPLVSAATLGAGALGGVAMARAIWSRTAKAFRKKAERLRDEIIRHLRR